jgi:hypothetical protein
MSGQKQENVGSETAKCQVKNEKKRKEEKKENIDLVLSHKLRIIVTALGRTCCSCSDVGIWIREPAARAVSPAYTRCRYIYIYIYICIDRSIDR